MSIAPPRKLSKWPAGCASGLRRSCVPLHRVEDVIAAAIDSVSDQSSSDSTRKKGQKVDSYISGASKALGATDAG